MTVLTCGETPYIDLKEVEKVKAANAPTEGKKFCTLQMIMALVACHNHTPFLYTQPSKDLFMKCVVLRHWAFQRGIQVSKVSFDDFSLFFL